MADLVLQFSRRCSIFTFMPDRWDRIDEKILISTPIFDLRSRRLRRQGDAAEDDFYALTCSDWVQVLALTPQRELVLVRQYRFGSEDFFWEIPGGIIDEKEAPLVAGVRELQEETGYAGNARLLTSIVPNPAILNNRSHIVLVEEAMCVHSTDWDRYEQMEVLALPLKAVWDWVNQGKITHACVLSALFHLKLLIEF